MEMQIIETILALVLVYLALALLVSHLQELLSGLAGGRGMTLARMVEQVFNGDQTLVQSFFAYPPISALSPDGKKPGGIPPDLFARAYLAVLNGNTPPRVGRAGGGAPFASPAEFAQQVQAGPAAKAVLQHHAAGAGKDWDAFEANVALWIYDIGNRATGWFKRRKAAWLLLVAGLLVFAVDADTSYMARVFMNDEQTRVAFANLAELVNSQHQGAKADDPGARKLTPAASSSERARQAGEQFVTASSEIGLALKDPKIVAFGSNRDDVRQQCGGELPAQAVGKKAKVFASNSDAWVALLPVIMQHLGEARLGVAFVSQGQDTSSGAVSATVNLGSARRAEVLGDVLACANVVHAWVASAQHHADDDAANIHLANAEKALQAGIDIVHAERVDSVGHELLPVLLLADEDAFHLCADHSGDDRAAFEQCLASAGSSTRLPLGWQNRFSQLCSPYAPAASEPRAWFDACPVYEGKPQLGIEPFRTTWSGAKLLSVLGGLVFSALMVSLGAPFWWGVLGKVADLRLAGSVRGLEPKDDPSKPASPPTAPSPAPAPAAPAKKDDGGAASVDGAANAFERGLQPQDVTRVQKALGVDATGRLDGPTRDAIEAALKTLGRPDETELSAINYPLITGRQAAVAATPATASGEWRRGQTVPVAARAALATALNTLFPAQNHWKALDTQSDKYDDTLRARVVLYRALNSPAAAALQFEHADIVPLATQPDGPLCRLEDALRQAIVASQRNPFARLKPYWLDVALGELGITEDGSPRQSDPRVVEYLTALGEPAIVGDETPWCGAFVGWVLGKAGLLAAPDLRCPVSDLLRAANWLGYGGPVAAGTEQCGDICVVETGGNQHHVGFWIDGDATRFWLLGGNQGKTGSGGVTLVAWRRSAYPFKAVRPGGLASPPPAV